MKLCPIRCLPLLVIFILLSVASININTLNAQSRVIEYSTEIETGINTLKYSGFVHVLIENEEDQHYGNISLRYKGKNNLDITEAAIFNKHGGLVRKLSTSEIITESDFDEMSFITDYYTKTFRLAWNDYPYSIKYSYKETVKDFITIADWTPYWHENLAVENASLTFTCPKQTKIRIKADSIFDVSSSVDGFNEIHKWTVKKLPVIVNEQFSPSVYTLSPKVKIVPLRFNYEKYGSFENWESFGAWVAGLMKNKTSITKEEKLIIEPIIKSARDKRELINNLVNYRRNNTRYLNISIKKSGMIPISAAETCYSKLGDCKALTVYMKALLQDAGIESYYTLVKSGEKPEPFDENFPDMIFDHVILAVPLENDTIWIENTSDQHPAGYIGTFTQNRIGLMCDENGSKLVQIPSLKQDGIGDISEYHLHLTKDGVATGKMVKVARGPDYEYYAAFFNMYTNLQKKKQLELSYYPHIVKLDSISHSITDINTPEIKISAQIKLDNHWIDDENNILINLFNQKPAMPPFIAEKKSDFSVDYPVFVKETIHYDISDLKGYNLVLPKDFSVVSPFGHFKLNILNKDESLIVISEYSLQPGSYKKEDYKKFYDFFYTIYQSF